MINSEQIEKRDITVGILGIGHTGLPLAVAISENNYRTIGYDINEELVGKLQNNNSHIEDVTSDDLQQSKLEITHNPEKLSQCDVFIISVPTDTKKNNNPEMDYLEQAVDTINENGTDDILIINTSTVYPGASRELILEKVTHEALVSMTPMRFNPGGEYDITDIPVVVGSSTEEGQKLTQLLFEEVNIPTHEVETLDSAEMSKLIENTYRMVNIALVNDIVEMNEKLNGDIWEAIEAASTKPFGYQEFYPGPGVGGHCIPVDPLFVSWKAEELNTSVNLVDVADSINSKMPIKVSQSIEKIADNKDDILILGCAYKPDVGDTRNSPAIDIINHLSEDYNLTIVDPYAELDDYTVHNTLEQEIIEQHDVTVLLVDHTVFDLEEIIKNSDTVIDTKNAVPQDINTEIIRLGDDLLAR